MTAHRTRYDTLTAADTCIDHRIPMSFQDFFQESEFERYDQGYP
jgi:hypothetical protein